MRVYAVYSKTHTRLFTDRMIESNLKLRDDEDASRKGDQTNKKMVYLGIHKGRHAHVFLRQEAQRAESCRY